MTDAGVNVASLEELASKRAEGLKRSNHVLLVKNLPYGCSGDELTNMFEKYGSLDKLILPPTKTMALVCGISLCFSLLNRTSNCSTQLFPNISMLFWEHMPLFDDCYEVQFYVGWYIWWRGTED